MMAITVTPGGAMAIVLATSVGQAHVSVRRITAGSRPRIGTGSPLSTSSNAGMVRPIRSAGGAGGGGFSLPYRARSHQAWASVRGAGYHESSASPWIPGSVTQP